VGWTLVTDFDGTLVEQIVPSLVDGVVGGPDVSALDQAYRRGAIGLGEYTRRRFAGWRITRQQLVDAVRAVTVRPGAAEVVALCRAHGIPLRVVSSGLDAYVLPLVAPLGIVPDEVVCSRADFADDGIVATAPDDVDGEDFKAAVVRAERARGQRVLYVGDGSNDRAAAERANFVLARRRLLEHCRARGIPHAGFDDFTDVAAWMRANVGAEGETPQHR
jgi:HAD superfamily phosphoserine phosphatase-like hydrolase